MRHCCLLVTIVAVGVGIQFPAAARLGGSEADAKLEMSLSKAHTPSLILNSSGRVIWENWSAPPSLWTPAQADEVRPLMQSNAKLVRRQKLPRTAGGYDVRYSYADGSTVEYTVFGGWVNSITAASKEYKALKYTDPNQVRRFETFH